MKPQDTSWLCLIILLLSIRSEASVGSRKTHEAYVTLLYGDEFLLGVRVLGKSIRDTGSKNDMVVLVSDGVSDYGNDLLQVHSPRCFFFFFFNCELRWCYRFRKKNEICCLGLLRLVLYIEILILNFWTWWSMKHRYRKRQYLKFVGRYSYSVTYKISIKLTKKYKS